ncbi:DUF6000 family protein [Streptomyces sp. NPDC026206]|uniref:DUF6000 family protein n=1 Tax=Streptomyces sp. NPDC026206 TaxID=3157089 RepID=UPI0033FDF24F
MDEDVWMEHPLYTDHQLGLFQRYVTPDEAPDRYMKLLHGNVERIPEPKKPAFFQSLVTAAHEATDEDLTTLLKMNWRGRLVAGWLAGFDRRTQFRECLGDLLLKSQFPFAGQGYCFALARFGTPDDAALLVSYLHWWLRRPDCR